MHDTAKVAEKIGAKLLNWHSHGDEVCAVSRCHDDGTPFVYRFERASDGWRNCTDLELCEPRIERFLCIDDATRWAEQCERGWIAEFAHV